jgi:ribosomal protein L24
MKKLRAEDPVMVISGKFKGKVSTIERIADDNVFVK